MQKILIIEDDMDIAELERDYLEANGFSVEIVGDGALGEKRALEADVDLILLDIMLPGMDGFQICRKVREARNIPILLVSARQEDVDKIRGLGLGADDYIVKPFSPSELVARVKAHLQRYLQLTGKKDGPHVFQRGALTIDRDGHRVFLDGREVPMPNKEFALRKIPVWSSAKKPCLNGSGVKLPWEIQRQFPSTSTGSGKKSNHPPPDPPISRPYGA